MARHAWLLAAVAPLALACSLPACPDGVVSLGVRTCLDLDPAWLADVEASATTTLEVTGTVETIGDAAAAGACSTGGRALGLESSPRRSAGQRVPSG